MKLTHLVGLLTIAVAIGIIVSTAGDASTYVNFTQATAMAQAGDNDLIHVVGKLPKNSKRQVTGLLYDPRFDPNRFEFTLTDLQGVRCQCIYASPKPQDFERAEQIVVIGSMQGVTFAVQKILLKCPSKYQQGKLETTEFEAGSRQTGPRPI